MPSTKLLFAAAPTATRPSTPVRRVDIPYGEARAIATFRALYPLPRVILLAVEPA